MAEWTTDDLRKRVPRDWWGAIWSAVMQGSWQREAGNAYADRMEKLATRKRAREGRRAFGRVTNLRIAELPARERGEA